MQDTFRLSAAVYARHHEVIHGVRQTVFVQGQGIDPALEADAADQTAVHVMAWSSDNLPIGTGRLTRDGRIGRMAVLAHARGAGVGEAMLAWLCDQASQQRLGEIRLDAQLPAYSLYARLGFIPVGEPHETAGLPHQSMRRRLDGAMDIQTIAAAEAAIASVIHNAGRELKLIAPLLDPDLLDRPLVFNSLRRWVARPVHKQISLLLDDPQGVARDSGAVLALAQRLPSVFSLRERDIDSRPAGQADALALNDRGWWFQRPTASLPTGRAGLPWRPAGRTLHECFAQQWASSLPCDQLRSLGF